MELEEGKGFLNGSWGKDSTCNAGDTEDTIRSQVQEDSLEKEMATHCSILAWEIPWTVEPGGLWPKGSQRVGHD